MAREAKAKKKMSQNRESTKAINLYQDGMGSVNDPNGKKSSENHNVNKLELPPTNGDCNYRSGRR